MAIDSGIRNDQFIGIDPSGHLWVGGSSLVGGNSMVKPSCVTRQPLQASRGTMCSVIVLYSTVGSG